MHDNLIRLASKKITDSIFEAFKKAWLAHHESEISAEVTSTATEQETRNATRYKYTPPIDPTAVREDTTYIHGIQVKTADLYRIYADQYSIRDKITDRYKQEFDLNHMPSIEATFTRQLNSLGLNKLVADFLTRHPWLQASVADDSQTPSDNNIPWKFLEKWLQQCIKSKLVAPIALKNVLDANDWGAITKKDLIEKAFQWTAPTETERKNFIEGYPYSEVKRLYYLTTPPNVPGIGDIISNQRYYSYDTSGLPNLTISRIDILRLLTRRYPSEMEAQACGGIATTKLAVWHIDELAHLSQQQWAHFQTLFINVGSEADPVWTLIDKQAGKWVAYLPSEDAKLALQAKIPDLTTQVVNYADNLVHNDMKELNTKSQWHAVLLSRVLPSVVEKQPLENYAHGTPLPLLMQKTMRDCLDRYFSYTENVRNAFTLRAPFSEHNSAALFGYNGRDTHPLIADEFFKQLAFDEETINRFVTKEFSFDDSDHSFHIDAPGASQLSLVLALKMLYHTPEVKRLHYVPGAEADALLNTLIDNLFNYNDKLLSIKATACLNTKSYQLGWSCTARNRFLNSISASCLTPDTPSMEKYRRYKLWESTGQALLDFYVQHGKKMDLDFAEAHKDIDANWRISNCDHEAKSAVTTDLMWSFMQIAQMGPIGLTKLFEAIEIKYANSWVKDDHEIAPNLALCFDLRGQLYSQPSDYIKSLTAKIKQFDAKKRGCSPLLQSLSLILPNTLDEASKTELINLFLALNARREQNPNEVNEIILHNVDNQSAVTKAFLDDLQAQAYSTFFQISLRIPAWDRAAPTELTPCGMKNLYHSIQNTVLNNQRRENSAELENNMQNIYFASQGALAPHHKLGEEISPKPQSFEGEDVVYPLAPQKSPDVQQQLAQSVEQEVQIEQEQEEETDVEIAIENYTKWDAALITRENIDRECKAIWATIPEECKNQSGWNKADLKQLFSLWVGSERNAQHVIEKIEMEAIQKIMLFAPQFRFGIAKDNLPPGFYLAYTGRGEKGLILCFDEKRERDDLRKRELMPAKKRNPFTVQLKALTPATVFRGDIRQLDTLTQDDSITHTLWRYLATEDGDKLRITNAQKSLPDLNLSEENAPVAKQVWDLQGTAKIPGSFASCLRDFQRWAGARFGLNHELSTLLFQTPDTQFTEANVKAFGQLFNHYDVDDYGVRTATEHWFFIAEQIRSTFKPEHFAIWKSAMLDPLHSWAECLEKSELDALSQCLATLKDKPALQDLWWQLVAAHAKSTGRASFKELWAAFDTVLGYADEKKISIDNAKVAAFLNKTPDFNALVFLDRLHYVVRKSNDKQLVLDNLPNINWCHNGFYYAKRFDNYPYWSKALDLEGFHQSTSGTTDPTSYSVFWHAKSKITDLKTQTLRFGTHRTRMNPQELNHFEYLLDNCAPLESDTLRLFTACLATGVDTIEQWSKEELNKQFAGFAALDAGLKATLNRQLSLDQPLTQNLQMPFADMLTFVKTIQETDKNIFAQFVQAGSMLEFINASARAMQWYRKLGQPEGFKKLIASVKTLGINSTLLTTYPWAIVEQKFEPCPFIKAKDSGGRAVRAEIDTFKTQLQSIDIERSTYWPDYKQLCQYCESISGAFDPSGMREKIIGELIGLGCKISFQGANFRPLEKLEIKKTLEYLEGKFKEQNRQQNLPLCAALLGRVAVLASTSAAGIDRTLSRLKDLFVKLDNKVHHNELGQVLGLLLEASGKDNKNRHYSLTQMLDLLSGLLDEQRFELGHYPITMLATILEHEVKKDPSTLINQDLHELEEKADSQRLVKEAQTIAASTISDEYKPLLINLVLQDKSKTEVAEALKLLSTLQAAKVKSKWVKAIAKILSHDPAFDKATIKLLSARENSFTTTASPELVAQWQHTQITWCDLLLENKVSEQELKDSHSVANFKNAYQSIIVAAAMKLESSANPGLIASLNTPLGKLAEGELKALANYYNTKPKLNANTLLQIISNPAFNQAESIIHRYEAEIQSLDAKGNSLRIYSISEDDHRNLERILAGFTRKGQSKIADAEQKQLINLLYLTNGFAQLNKLEKKTLKDLNEGLRKTLDTIKQPGIQELEQRLAKGKVLAYMREICLRKTGKWANHTQMLDLLYAAIHNDESLLHQVKTGEGKSIISILRASYLALNGSVVDVFSAKESLSKRDYEEFSPVLDAMGIPNAYIAANSPPKTYKDEIIGSIGAVNYATPGNFSLYQAAQIWNGERKINLHPVNRVAYLDECDFILLDEQTQFNFSDSGATDGVFNLDKWVYDIAYDYFDTHKDFFPTNEAGIPSISRNVHLKALCELLLKGWAKAPKQSTFIKNYILPALNNQPETMERRDQYLHQLLTAAYTASQLKENVNYCISSEQKQVGDGKFLDVRLAHVIIDNQKRIGSSYSELVQQLLHVRLNKEAIAKNERPNFFVDPYCQIALSQNINYLLNNYYSKIEGCSGTTGNKADLAAIRNMFGIKHVIKLPTNKSSQTTFLPTLCLENKQAQIDAIAQAIMANTQEPILITCKDDIAVEEFYKLLRVKLQQLGLDETKRPLYKDVNSSGKSEADVVPSAGKVGAITISSRMGRGTDIKPEVKSGLRVIRTYPDILRTVKQEFGRQGRNGEAGFCQDIFDYGEVERAYNAYKAKYTQELANIEGIEQAKLTAKLDKHKAKDSKKWEWLANNPEAQRAFVVTRTVVSLQAELEERQQLFLRRKEMLIAKISGNLMAVLHNKIGQDVDDASSMLKVRWLDCRKKIEAAWNTRLAGRPEDSEEVYQEFFQAANAEWQKFTDLDADLQAQLLEAQEPAPEPPSPVPVLEGQHADFPAVLSLYQSWLQGAMGAYCIPEANDKTVQALMGGDPNQLDELYKVLEKTSTGPVAQAQDREKLFKKLKEIFQHPQSYSVSGKKWAAAISELATKVNQPEFEASFQCYTAFFNLPWMTKTQPGAKDFEDIKKISRLHVLNTKIINTKYVAEHNASQDFVTNLSNAIHEYFWDKFDDNLSDEIEDFLATEPAVTEYLVRHTNKADLGYCINLLRANQGSPWHDERLQQLKDYISQNGAEILNHPGIIRPLFELTLAAPSTDRPLNYLPAPNCLPAHLQAQENNFWYFLSQRMPITQEAVTPLLSCLNEVVNIPDFNKFLEPLFNLPPYISLAYINKQLQWMPGKHYSKDFEKALKALENAAKSFNHCMSGKGILPSETGFEQPSSAWTQWLDLFYVMSPAKNEKFFEIASSKKYAAVLPSTLGLLAKSYHSEELANPIVLHEALALAENIQGQAGTKQTFLHQQMELLLAEPGPNKANKVKQLQDFVNTVVKNNDSLDETGLTNLFNQYKTANSPTLAMQTAEVYQALQTFDKRFPGLNYKQAYEKVAASAENNQFYLDLLTLMNQSEYADLALNTVAALCQAYFDKKLANIALLKQAIELAKKAKQLQDENNWAEYFATFESKKRKERLQLMQLLHHKMLDMGEEFKDRCYKEYKTLAEKLTKLPEDFYDNEPKERHAILKAHYHQILKFTKEMSTIAKPFSNGATGTEFTQPVESVEALQTSHKKFFADQAALYHSFWWKNKERKQQAASLFEALDIASTATNKGEYYQNTLQIIWNTQQVILNSDKETDRNGKGYSRLYDITSTMFLNIARDCLADIEDLTYDQKVSLQQMMQGQFKFHIDILETRLPEDHPLKLKMTELKTKSSASSKWEQGSTELAALGEELGKVNRKTVPKYLHYLLDNLDCFFNAEEAPKPAMALGA